MKKSSNEKCKTRYNRLMTDLGYESKTIDTEYSEKTGRQAAVEHPRHGCRNLSCVGLLYRTRK